MKLQRFFKMSCLVLAVTLFSCESDTLETTDTPEQELVPSTLVFNRKSGSEMTQLLKKQGLSFLLEASNESGKGNKLYLGDVLETIDSLDNKNYSFNFNIENQKENEFYNLVLNKASDGIDAEPIVLKFISEESSLDSFVASSFDFYKFTGTIERYTLNSFLNSSSFTGKSGEPCDKIEIDNIDTVDDDAFSYGDATPPGGWDSGTQGDGGFTDDGCTMDLIVTHKPPGSNKTFVFGPDSVCQHNFTCEIVFTLVQDCNGPATNKSSGSDCPSANGPVGINLVTVTNERIAKLERKFGLTKDEQSFLRSHYLLLSRYYTFLEQFGYTPENNEFVKLSINQFISNPESSVGTFINDLNLFQDTKITFDSLVENFSNISGTHFDSNNKEIFDDYCAINLSHALLKSGVTIDSGKVVKCWGCSDSEYKNKHGIRAQELAEWLKISNIEGLSKVKVLTGNNFQEYVKGKKGIIFFKDYWKRDTDAEGNRTGDHIDLWDENELVSSGWFGTWFRVSFPDLSEALGTSDLTKSNQVLFWQL